MSKMNLDYFDPHESTCENIRDTLAAIKIDLNDLDGPDLTCSQFDDLKISIETKLNQIEDSVDSLDFHHN